MASNKILEWIWANKTDIGLFLAGVWGAVKGIVWFYKKIIKPGIKIFEDIKQQGKDIASMKSNLLPNGGKSLSDAITRIENKLTAAASTQTSMLELSEIAIFQTSETGECTNANNALCKIFGATREQMLGYGWLHFIENSEQQRVIWESAIESDNEIVNEYVINVGGDKRNRINAKYVAYIKRDPRGNILNVIGKVMPVK